MKVLLSVNKKFYEVNMKTLFDLIDFKDINKAVGGMELNISSLSKYERDLAKDIAKKLKKRNLKLQIHGNMLSENVLEIYEYLKLYNELAKIMEDKIKIVYHPYKDESKENIIYKTTVILKRLNKNIEDFKYNIELSIENLEDVENVKNLKIDELSGIIDKVKNVKITYDIGHMVLENKNPYTISEKIYSKITNVHIHDISASNIAHYPFSCGKVDLKATMVFLKKIKYTGDIVAEIALDYLQGITYEEKLDAYLKEVENIKTNKDKYFV
ncbi:MAG: sugar phosphate isomerase/epimerase [Clostridia bacterium]